MMKTFPPLINDIIELSGLNLHNIHQASGVSNAYLAKLMKGNINRPGKDKIASILLTLNYTVSAINEVLSEYDYQHLQQSDIPAILNNNSGRKIAGGNLPQYDHIYFDLFLVALERIGGVKKLVKNRPSGVFMPRELSMMREFPQEGNDAAAIFRYHLAEALARERSQLFLENCRSGCRVETYICRSCLDEYLGSNIGETARRQNPRRVRLVTQYFANALSLSLKYPGMYRMFIVEHCPYFHFQIQDAEGVSPKVSYTGKKLHTFENQHDKRILEGFTVDLPHIVSLFKQEAAMCHGTILPGMVDTYPQSIVSYCEEAFNRYGMAEELVLSLKSLMKLEEISFY